MKLFSSESHLLLYCGYYSPLCSAFVQSSLLNSLTNLTSKTRVIINTSICVLRMSIIKRHSAILPWHHLGRRLQPETGAEKLSLSLVLPCPWKEPSVCVSAGSLTVAQEHATWTCLRLFDSSVTTFSEERYLVVDCSPPPPPDQGTVTNVFSSSYCVC